MNSKRRISVPGKKTVIKIIIAVIIAAIVISLLITALSGAVKDKYSGEAESAYKATVVTRGSIGTLVTGDGTIEDDDVKTLDIIDGVKIEKVYVSAGDKVSEGQMIASVDANSVMTKMADISDQIKELDKQIDYATKNVVSTYLRSNVSGRVKIIYAAKGDNVPSVMYKHGALMVLSIDGFMCMDIPAGDLKVGDLLTLICGETNPHIGRVTEISNSVAKIMVSDKLFKVDDLVKVKDEDGNEIASGNLYINEPLNVIGYAGTVNSVNVKINDLVDTATNLLSLADTEYTANYQALLDQRSELEDDLNHLINFYKETGICAETSGTVKALNAENGSTASEDSTHETRFVKICPDEKMTVTVNVDESEILSVSLGQKATVTMDSLPDRQFEGEVTEIDRTGKSSGGVTSYRATVTFAKEDGMLAGMSATVRIQVTAVKNGLIIPTDAINRSSTSCFVYTSYDSQADQLTGLREVVTGVSNDEFTEIVSGLSEGETVCYRDKNSTIVKVGGMTFDTNDFSDISSEELQHAGVSNVGG